MNYWSAEMSNLDVTQPLFDYIQVNDIANNLRETQEIDLISSAEYLGTPWRVHRSSSVQRQRRIRDAR